MSGRKSGEQRRSGSAESRTDRARSAQVAERWGALAERLVDRLVHEVRNPLNGAVVNLQVVVARAERPGQDAAALAPFAASAAAELERAVALVESLLTVIRTPPRDRDAAAVVNRLGPAFTAAAVRNGATITVSAPASVPTGAAPDALRLAVGAALEAAAGAPGVAEVELLAGDAPGLLVRPPSTGGENERPIDKQLVEVLAAAGITWETTESGFALHFPAAGAGDDA